MPGAVDKSLASGSRRAWRSSPTNREENGLDQDSTQEHSSRPAGLVTARWGSRKVSSGARPHVIAGDGQVIANGHSIVVCSMGCPPAATTGYGSERRHHSRHRHPARPTAPTNHGQRPSGRTSEPGHRLSSAIAGGPEESDREERSTRPSGRGGLPALASLRASDQPRRRLTDQRRVAVMRLRRSRPSSIAACA